MWFEPKTAVRSGKRLLEAGQYLLLDSLGARHTQQRQPKREVQWQTSHFENLCPYPWADPTLICERHGLSQVQSRPQATSLNERNQSHGANRRCNGNSEQSRDCLHNLRRPDEVRVFGYEGYQLFPVHPVVHVILFSTNQSRAR
jgi:hypothetical protein